ncbi:Outer membrane protein assembly factor BamB precursor [Thalassoglobus neptunius]|uniref:Outer membrane protein assembly factor BamB n=1 Tax=Thalassoglobus neptunius TaxID=1938619 RepID=A0A5C5VWI1_9PLAN|nr:PQQ-binding-like beta-propeller repeat protein [Thalassoglobus neptunius]TWT43036.1 Outer membrane protein assembly factor BamB precursor [Thalassoglobus neptunius]
MSRTRWHQCALAVVFNLVLSPAWLPADDWPQWMGPSRDNVWREANLIERFPDEGPKIAWRTPVSGGYSGPAVAHSRVVITDYMTQEDVNVENFQRKQFSGTERVHCLNEQTGEVLWTHQYPVNYEISYPAGPRCTPVISDNLVYTLGAEGNLFCLGLHDGEIIWSKNLTEDYNVQTPLWGYAGHPLLDGDRLICIVGGEGTHAVAFHATTGEEIWRARSSSQQGYSPPLIVNIAGIRQLLLFQPSEVAAVNPENGELYWSLPYEATNGSTIMSPIVSGNYVYVGGYSNKNMLIKVSEDGLNAEAVWKDLPKQAVSPINVQPIRVDETIFGFDQNGLLYGIDVQSGNRIWHSGELLNTDRPIGSGTAFLVRQEDRYWIFNELGELVIAKLSRDGYEEIDRAKVIDQTNTAFGRDVVWSMPAFANKRAYIRNGRECICVELAK